MKPEDRLTLGWSWQGQCIDNWFASEKLWDVRCLWDGRQGWTRSGKPIALPDWFTSAMPATTLDGGIYRPADGQRKGKWQETAAVNGVRYGRWSSRLVFMVYDVPLAPGSIIERLMTIAENAVVHTVTPQRITGEAELHAMFTKILAQGGEGVVLRSPGPLPYEVGRTHNFLKVKSEEQFTRIAA